MAKDPQYRTGQKNPRGQRICGAKTRSGQPCQQTSLGPAGRCRFHNGYAARGIAHPGFKHGRYSKDLPSRLTERYQEALHDPERLALDNEIALITSRLGDLLSRVNAGEHAQLWQRARDAFNDFYTLLLARQYEEMMGPLERTRMLLQQGHSESHAWLDIERLVLTRKKLVDSERQRLVQGQQMITAEQAMALVSAMVDVIHRHVDDPTTKAHIGAEFARLIGTTGPEQPSP